jgi:hypothetical protein
LHAGSDLARVQGSSQSSAVRGSQARAAQLCIDLHASGKRLEGIEVDGEFEKTKKRAIVFLDTPDETIALNRLVFRQRTDFEKERTEYTLKCRSPDRYVAAGADLKAGNGFEEEIKLEEDISAPFSVRFSHSNTIQGRAKAPKNLQEAAEMFPVLGKLERDGNLCPDDVLLRPVKAIEAYERVLVGPIVKFKKTEAEVALILWSDGKDGRPLVAELSYRYGNDDGRYTPGVASLAMRFFEELQRLDWCAPNAQTKTQFVYA